MFISKYEIKFGDVWLREAPETILNTGLRHVCDANGELAIAFAGNQFLKCGNSKSVSEWLSKYRSCLILEEDAELEVVHFLVSDETVYELNACMENPNRLPDFIKNLQRIGIVRPEINSRPIYPMS